MRIADCLLVTVALLGVCSACRKQTADDESQAQASHGLSVGVHYGNGCQRISELPLDAVLLRVNGSPFTRRDFEFDQDVYCKLIGYLRSGKVDGVSNDSGKLKAMRAPKVLNTVLRRELLNQEARRRNIKASDAARSARRKEIEDLFSAGENVKDSQLSIESFVDQLGDDCGRYFLQTVEKDAENLELSWQAAGSRIAVSEEDVTAGSNRLAKANALVAATNAVLNARLMTALHRVQAGEDFAAVGAELSMFECDESKLWGTFSVEDFEDTGFSDMSRFLNTRPAQGTVAGPFQCDDGVSIVKVLEIIQGEGDESSDEVEDGSDEVENRSTYKLARISVEIFEEHKSLSRDEIRKILEENKRKKFEAEFGRSLFDSAVIEFPSGTNLFAAASEKLESGSDLTITEQQETKESGNAQ